MTITKVLKVFAIVLMTVVMLVLASWSDTIWIRGIDFLGGVLPTGDEPIAVALRGYLPTVKSAGTIIVLMIFGILGWSFGRRIWTA